MDNIAFSTLFFSLDYPDGIITNGVLVVMLISYSLPYDLITQFPKLKVFMPQS